LIALNLNKKHLCSGSEKVQLGSLLEDF